MATQIVQYDITAEQIEAKRAEYAALTTDTPEGYEKVRKGIAHWRGARTSIEALRKELKRKPLELCRVIDAEAKKLVALIEPIESDLKAKKQAVDDERARIRREKEEARLREIEERIRAEREAEEAKLRAEREAEEARLAKERAALEAEQRKLAEQKAALEAEAARVRREREAVERAEREREAEEARRLAELERQKQEAARLEALKPDVEKLRDFTAALRTVQCAELSTDEAKSVLADVLDHIETAADVLDAFCATTKSEAA